MKLWTNIIGVVNNFLKKFKENFKKIKKNCKKMLVG